MSGDESAISTVSASISNSRNSRSIFIWAVNVTQTNQTTEQNFDVLFSDFKQFLADIQTRYPTIKDEVAVAQIIDVEAKLIEAKDQKRWQNFLNLKRLWNGGKKAAIKVGEHFVEQNPWGKGAIAFLEGVSEDTK